MTALDAIYDIERLCSRIAYSTVHARDCDCLRHSLEKLPGVITTLQGLKANEFQRIHGTLDPMDDICALLTSAIIDNPPLSVKDGAAACGADGGSQGIVIGKKPPEHLPLPAARIMPRTA